MSRTRLAAVAVGTLAIAVAERWLPMAMLLPLLVPERGTARSTSASVPQGAWS